MAAINVSADVHSFMQAANAAAARTTLGIALTQAASSALVQTGAFTVTLAAGATVTLTLPLVSGTLATLAGTENLTNKTITSGALTTCTIGSAGITLVGSTSGSLVLKAAAIAGSGTMTIPSGTDTLVTLTGTQTLTNKTFTAPILGAATATSINGLTVTSTTGTLTLANGSTLVTSGANSLTLTTTGATVATFPSGTVTLYGTGSGSITSAQLRTSLTDETGTGSAVFATSPTLTTPILGAATGTSLVLSGALTVGSAAEFSSSINATSVGANTISANDVMVFTNGSSVSQATSKSTGVSINVSTGDITMNAAALADATNVKFTVSNTYAKNPGVVIVNHTSGGTAGAYQVTACNIVDGVSFDIVVRNVSGGSLSESPVIHFIVIGGSISP